ncbi:MAG: hypothetical protein AAGH46_10865, partial [Bacteroidota bacterium]
AQQNSPRKALDSENAYDLTTVSIYTHTPEDTKDSLSGANPGYQSEQPLLSSLPDGQAEDLLSYYGFYKYSEKNLFPTSSEEEKNLVIGNADRPLLDEAISYEHNRTEGIGTSSLYVYSDSKPSSLFYIASVFEQSASFTDWLWLIYGENA